MFLQVFGSRVYDVGITDDLLMVFMYDSCQYYSLQWIFDNVSLKFACVHMFTLSLSLSLSNCWILK